MTEALAIIAAGIAAGVISGMFGVGGGILFVPALVLIQDLPQVEAEATSLLAMLPLAVTSTKGWIRRLGKKWQTLHKLVYVAGIAGALHFIWKTKIPEPEPYLYGAAVVLLLGIRVVFTWQKRQAAASKVGK